MYIKTLICEKNYCIKKNKLPKFVVQMKKRELKLKDLKA